MSRGSILRRTAIRCATSIMAVIVGLCVFDSVATAQDNVLERPVGSDYLGAPIVWAPDGIDNGLWARRVSQGAQVPVVFEAAAPRPQRGLPTRVDLTVLTVAQAFDALVAADRRYEWRLEGSAVIVRPTYAWSDESHPLHGRAGAKRRGSESLTETVRDAVGGEAGSARMAALATKIDGATRIEKPAVSLHVLQRLAELAAEGNVFMQVRDPRIAEGPMVEISTWNGVSYPFTVKQNKAAADKEESSK